MWFGKITSGAKYRIDQKFKKISIFRISIIFEIKKIWEFVNFPSCKIIDISKFSNLVDQTNFQSQILKIYNLKY